MDSEELTRAWLEVDLDAIRRNAVRTVQRAGVRAIAMLKSDAYGLGAVEVARALRDVQDIWGFGVATLEEARALRAGGVNARLFTPTPILPADFALARAMRVAPALSCAEDIERWVAEANDRHPWHLAIDTGMNRAGVPWNEAGSLASLLTRHPPEGAFTHFLANDIVDASRPMQEARFRRAIEAAGVDGGTVLLHTDNSLGVAARVGQAWDLVRPGIALYGWPSGPELALDGVVRLKARVVELRTVEAGEGVSYGASWRAGEARRVATLSIGYADGYRRHFSNAGQVVINGTRCPVVGMVTMDMTMVDVTDAECAVGDSATLIDAAVGLGLDVAAESARLSPYELLVGLRMRVARVYSGGQQALALEQDL